MITASDILLLLEARKRPRTPKQSLIDFLRQYKDDPDIYIHYSSIPKLGINPSQNLSATPLGLYFYPLKIVWNESGGRTTLDTTWAKGGAYVYVVRSKNEKGFLKDMHNDYTEAMLERDADKLAKMFTIDKDDKLIRNTGEVKKGKKANINFWRENKFVLGIMKKIHVVFSKQYPDYNTLEKTANFFFGADDPHNPTVSPYYKGHDGQVEILEHYQDFDLQDMGIDFHNDWEKVWKAFQKAQGVGVQLLNDKFRARFEKDGEYSHFVRGMYHYSMTVTKKPIERYWIGVWRISHELGEKEGVDPSIIQRKIHTTLGYKGFNDTGHGLIHFNEKAQAVFFNTKSFKHIDTYVQASRGALRAAHNYVRMRNNRLI
jgi:hypothetical protein